MPDLNRTRLQTTLDRCGSAEGVAGAVFAALAGDVPNVFACLALTDPLTGVITWAFKSHPLPIGDREFAAAEYGGPDVNQFAEIARRPVPFGVLSLDTGGDPLRSKRFCEYMVPQFGFSDELRVAVRDRGLVWGAIALYRGEGEEPFTAAEAERVAGLRRMIAAALRRTLFAEQPAGGAAAPAPAVIIVDAAGQPQQMTRAARERIEDLGGWDNGALPASLLAVAANARSGADVVVSRMRLGSGQWITLRGSALEGAPAPASVVVTIDLARPADLTGLTVAGHGLTAREQEVVTLALQGASTKAIAASLHLSPHTVQDHLKAIFAKIGVNSRRELIAHLVG